MDQCFLSARNFLSAQCFVHTNQLLKGLLPVLLGKGKVATYTQGSQAQGGQLTWSSEHVWKSQDFPGSILEPGSCHIHSLCYRRQELLKFSITARGDFLSYDAFPWSSQMIGTFLFRSTPFLIFCCSLRVLSLVGQRSGGGATPISLSSGNCMYKGWPLEVSAACEEFPKAPVLLDGRLL